MNSIFKQQSQKKSEISLKAIKKYLAKEKFLIGSHNETRLRRSLSLQGHLHLAETTLLHPEIHKIHASKLNDKFINHWNKLRDQKLKAHSAIQQSSKLHINSLKDKQIIDSSLRFLTLIDSISIMDVETTLKQIELFRSNLTKTIKSVRGISCLGVIEVEIVSLHYMKKVQSMNDILSISTQETSSESYKLNVCQTLSKEWANSVYDDGSSYALIHFHGLISAKKESNFTRLNEQLKNNDQWIKAPRQIELKKLSESYGGNKKTIESNLKDIARYITKGGNDWIGGKSYLRYKVSFNSDSGEEEWIARNWRRNEVLKKQHEHEGIVDVLSMTREEIYTLASLIDRLMGLKKDRTGYLVKVGSW